MVEALPPMGHNKPPEETISERLFDTYRGHRDAVAAIAERANKAPRTIANEADLDVVAVLMRDTIDLMKSIEADRVKEKDPFLRGGQAVDAYFKADSSRLLRIANAYQEVANAYHKRIDDEKRRKAAEDARKAREEADAREAAAQKAAEAGRISQATKHEAKADEARRQADLASQEATASLGDRAETIVTGSGIKSTAASDWKYEVTDYDAIDLNKLRLLIKREAVEKAIAQAIKNGTREIAGVRIYETAKAKFR